MSLSLICQVGDITTKGPWVFQWGSSRIKLLDRALLHNGSFSLPNLSPAHTGLFLCPASPHALSTDEQEAQLPTLESLLRCCCLCTPSRHRGYAPTFSVYLSRSCFSPRTQTFAFPVCVYLQGLEPGPSCCLHKYMQETEGCVELDPSLPESPGNPVNKDGRTWLPEREASSDRSVQEKKKMPPTTCVPSSTPQHTTLSQDWPCHSNHALTKQIPEDMPGDRGAVLDPGPASHLSSAREWLQESWGRGRGELQAETTASAVTCLPGPSYESKPHPGTLNSSPSLFSTPFSL